jgi:hypothetical protein
MFLIPMIQLVLLGYAATTDVDHISAAVFDQDQTAQSRELIETYQASGYFDINYHVASEEALARLIDGGEARAGLLIPLGYSKGLSRKGTAQVSVIIDGSDIFLSGFMFPIAAMPKVLQYFSYVVPLTYFLIIVRGIILKGIGLELLTEQVVAMAIFGVVILALAAARFRKRLE